MEDYEAMKVGELRKLITDKDDFKNKMGSTPSSASKIKLVNYLNGNYISPEVTPKLRKSPSESDLSKLIVNRPFDPNPPKLDKNFIPDNQKLEKIRETIPQPEVKSEVVPEELVDGLDEDDVHKLGNLLSTEEVNEAPSYVFNETSELKCKKYLELYPNLKPIISSPEFKSSDEKLKYVEAYLNSTRMNANLTNYLFMATTYIERNPTVNNYIKLRGYTKQLSTRRQELETYIEELKIKYMDEVGQYLEMPVEARLGLLFAETALQVHMENSQADIKQPPVKVDDHPTMN
jgi:hypothetical protein